MTLVKTSLLNGVAVGIRMLTMMVLNKLLAIYVGPSGYSAMGQFQNFVSMLTTFASGAVNTGVTKYTAEYFDDEERQISIWRTAGTMALAGSLVLGLLVAAFNRPLAGWLLKDESLAGAFVWLGAGLMLFTFNGLLLAILNGKKETRLFVLCNIAGSLIGLAITGALAVTWGLFGALVALALNQSLVFIVTLCLCRKTSWFRFDYLFGAIDREDLGRLARFTVMALTSAICLPVSQMLIRHHLGVSFGWPAAGHWEALMRISGLYLTLVTTPLAVYYLPRLAEIRGSREMKAEISRGYRLILPVAAAGALGIYLLRDWLVVTLFSAEFAPMRDLFAWQMAGDTAKIGSWLLAYVMVGKAMVRAFVVTEVTFSLTWVAFVWLLTGWYGEQGAQMGYFVNYVLYWLVMIALVSGHLRNVEDERPSEPGETPSQGELK